MALGFPDGDTLGHNDVMVQGKTLWCHVEKRHAFSRTTQGILNTRKGIPFLYGCIVFTFCLSSKTTFILIEAIKKAKNSTFLLTFVATEGYK